MSEEIRSDVTIAIGMRIGSLFSGAGMLDYAVEHIFTAEMVWHCENDPAASQVLEHRWPGIPNHHDITTVDWTQVEPVDLLCGGWPCQPFSLAGQQKGADDDRALWPYVAGAVRMVRPRIIVLENVSAVLGPEFSRVADSLAALGYSFSWTCLRACDVGAPHRRERLFVVAHTERGDRQQPDGHTAERRRSQHAEQTWMGDRGTVDLLPTPNAADGQRGQDYARANRDGSGGDDLVTLAVKATNASQWGKYEPAIQRWEQLTRPAPSPTEPNKNGNPRLAAAFSEWMMGWPAGWVTQTPGISRNDQLRIIGNGVVPQCAAAAIRYLLSIAEVAA